MKKIDESWPNDWTFGDTLADVSNDEIVMHSNRIRHATIERPIAGISLRA